MYMYDTSTTSVMRMQNFSRNYFKGQEGEEDIYGTYCVFVNKHNTNMDVGAA